MCDTGSHQQNAKNGPIYRYGIPFGVLIIVLIALLFLDREHRIHQWSAPSISVQAEALDEHNGIVQDEQVGRDYRQSVLRNRYDFFNRHCIGITRSSIEAVARAQSSSQGRGGITHFQDGKAVTEDATEFAAGTAFCSILLIPQKPSSTSHIESNFTIELADNWGPDAIHVEIASADVRLLSVDHPVHLYTLQSPSTLVEVYAIAYALNHPGEYQMSAEIEFSNYDWVMEDAVDTRIKELPHSIKSTPLLPASPALHINGAPISRPTRRCFTDSQTHDLRGRWYRAESFHPHSGSQTALNPAAALEFAVHNSTTDEHGWTFAPDECFLEYYSPQDHLSCFENRTIDVLGDSNGRRLMKAVIAGGAGWCSSETSPSNPACRCEDAKETSILDANLNSVDLSHLRKNEDQLIQIDFDRMTPIRFGRNSTAYMDFTGGLVNKRLFNPWDNYLNSTSDPSNSIIAQRMQVTGPIQVVVIAPLAWDVGTDLHALDLLGELPQFREALYREYPSETLFVHRLASATCCGTESKNKRFSAPRFSQFNTVWRDFWSEDEHQNRVMFDDASVLYGRPEMETGLTGGCRKATTHLRSSTLRIEEMFFMNAVCDKSSGSARLRQWTE